MAHSPRPFCGPAAAPAGRRCLRNLCEASEVDGQGRVQRELGVRALPDLVVPPGVVLPPELSHVSHALSPASRLHRGCPDPSSLRLRSDGLPPRLSAGFVLEAPGPWLLGQGLPLRGHWELPTGGAVRMAQPFFTRDFV